MRSASGCGPDQVLCAVRRTPASGAIPSPPEPAPRLTPAPAAQARGQLD